MSNPADKIPAGERDYVKEAWERFFKTREKEERRRKKCARCFGAGCPVCGGSGLGPDL